ncbi:MAG: cation:proton antiporter [Candidatus Aenigmarchaeota archaeon]|nr:cation:proton antiporter [Candidatus Aenigmarchaeota archaeon]
MAFEPVLLFQIALILLVAKVFGEVAERLKMSAIVGEIVAGLALGPLLHFVAPNEFLGQIANFGMLFIAFLIGIGIKFGEGKKDIADGSAIALAVSAASFLAGTAAGFYMFNSIGIGLFVGAAMMVSSTSVGIKSLADVGDIRSKAHDMIIMANKVDDILAVMAVSIVSSYIIFSVRNLYNMAAITAALGIALIFLLIYGAKWLAKIRMGRLKDENLILSLPLSAIFIASFIADKAGIASVAGAFLVGVAMGRMPSAETSVAPKMKILSYGFFAPLFFAYSAVLFQASSGAVADAVAISAVVIIVSFLCATIAGRRLGFSKKESMIIGASKTPRGEFSVIIAGIALAGAAITADAYSSIVLAILITALAAPFMMRALYRRA